MKKTSALFLLLVFLFPVAAFGEEAYKFTKPITIYTAAPSGIPTDIMLRMITGRMEKELGVSVNIIPSPGGGGNTCLLKTLAAPHDGHTYTWTSSYKLMAANLFKVDRVAYEEMIPVARMGHGNFRLVVKSGQYKDFDALLEAARQNPGKLNIAIMSHKTGIFATPVAEIEKRWGVKFNYVTFQDNGAVTAALLGGHIDAAVFLTTMGGSEAILNITGRDVPALQGVPTPESLGKEPIPMSTDMAILAPSDAPREALETFAAAFYNAMANNPELEDIALKADWYLAPGQSIPELQEDWKTGRADIQSLKDSGLFDLSGEGQ